MKSGKLVLGILLLLLAGVIAGCGSQGEDAAAAPEAQAIPVEVETTAGSEFAVTRTYTGRIMPESDVNVVPKVGGKVARVAVEVGDKVESGQLLVQLETTEMEQQLRQARAGLEMARTQLSGLETQLATLEETYNNTKFLYEEGAIPKSQYDQVRSQYDQLLTQKAAALSQIEQAEAGVALAQSQISSATITAPMSGTVIAVMVDEGELAGPTMPVVVIGKLDPVVVVLNVTEREITKVSLGQKVPVQVDALDGQTFEATVTSISPVVDQKSLGYPVKLTLSNTDGRLKAGMTATAELTLERLENVLTVPMEAVLDRNGRQAVFVVENNQAKIAHVETGLNNGARVVVTQGLKAGQQVVVRGQHLLEDGTKVSISARGE